MNKDIIDKVSKALRAIGPPNEVLPAAIYVILEHIRTEENYEHMLYRIDKLWTGIQKERGN